MWQICTGVKLTEADYPKNIFLGTICPGVHLFDPFVLIYSFPGPYFLESLKFMFYIFIKLNLRLRRFLKYSTQAITEAFMQKIFRTEIVFDLLMDQLWVGDPWGPLIISSWA